MPRPPAGSRLRERRHRRRSERHRSGFWDRLGEKLKVQVHVDGELKELSDLNELKELEILDDGDLEELTRLRDTGMAKLRDINIWGWQPFRKKEPPPVGEQIAKLILQEERAKSGFLVHLSTFGAGTTFLVTVNALSTMLMTDLPLVARLWSPIAVAAWGFAVVMHGIDVWATKAREVEEKRRDLEVQLALEEPDPSLDQPDDLKHRVITGAEAARESVRKRDPQVATLVTRGEGQALSVASWLAEAQDQVDGLSSLAALRRETALKVGNPAYRAQEKELMSLLSEIDRREQLVDRLGREARQRRERLESFLLALENTRLAAPEALPAAQAPLQERVNLLEELSSEPTAASDVGADRVARLEGELEMARDLQQSILPSEVPAVDGLQVARIYRPCNEVGRRLLRLLPARAAAAGGGAGRRQWARARQLDGLQHGQERALPSDVGAAGPWTKPWRRSTG